MKLHLLGTAGYEGWPAVFCGCAACRRARQAGGKNLRTRSNALIDDVYKIDLGPDTFHHALTYGLDLSKLEHIIYTHGHPDHFYPAELTNLFPPFAQRTSEQPAELHIWGPDTVMQGIEREIGVSLKDQPWVHLHTLQPFQTMQVGDALVTPLPANHDPNQTCFIYIFERGGRRLLYGHDSAYFPDETWHYLEGRRGATVQKLDGVLLGCAFGPNPGERLHMNIDTCLAVQRRLREAGCAHDETRFIATHFSHTGGLLHDELEAAFGDSGFIVAYDGLVVEI